MNLNSPVPAGAEGVVVELLDRIGRVRSLRDDESILLEKLVRRSQRGQRRTHKWTPENDRTLLRVQHRRRGVAKYAEEIGVSEGAAWFRLDSLRKKLRGGNDAAKVKG